MWLHELKIRNYRGIESMQYNFSRRFSMICGRNGTSKTTILDAAAVAIGGYLVSYTGVPNHPISRYDIRLATVNGVDLVPQVPTVVEASGEIMPGQQVAWKREVTRMALITINTTKDLTAALAVAKSLGDQVAAGQNPNLPVFVYAGQPRIWEDASIKVTYPTTDGFMQKGYRSALGPKLPTLEYIDHFKVLETSALAGDLPSKVLLDVFKRALNAVAYGWDDFTYDNKNKEFLCIKKLRGGGRRVLPHRALGDSYVAFMGLVGKIVMRCMRLNAHLGADVLTHSRGVVLIDDIERQLHPRFQKDIVAKLKQLFPQMQFIASTNSPVIIKQMQNAELIDLSGKSTTADYRDMSLDAIVEQEMGW